MAARAGVLFDLDGVIIDSEKLQYQAYQRVLEPLGVRITPEEYGREWIGNGRGAEYAVATYRLPLEPDELRQRRTAIYFDILSEQVTLMPGVTAALQRLGACFPLAVATNSNQRDTGFVLDHLGVRPFFAAVVTREMYQRAKPAPDAFATAADRIGLPPRRCVVIEDAYTGVVAAADAGCACVAIPHDFTRANDFSRATRIVESLDEVTVSLIDELVGTAALRDGH
jgi:HAD superfamily hydrolase (TIGR01509 family)